MKKLLFLIIFLGCNKKNEDLSLVLKNKEVSLNSICEFEITNISNSDYFLPLSNLEFENNLDDKYLYNSIFFQPVFTDETGIVIKPNNSKVIVKPFEESKSKDSLFNRKIELYNKHIKNFIQLEQFVKVNKAKINLLKQDIINYDELSVLSTSMKRYDFKKGKKYFIYFEYQLDKEYFDSKVDKKALNKLKKLDYKPYFGKLITNKVPFLPY